jgi:hypothetical protein
VRHGGVVWLLIVEPLRFALALDAALPRITTLHAMTWGGAVAQAILVTAGIAVARGLLDGASGAWRAVAWWALAAVPVTIAAHAAPLATTWAPSEARLADALAVAAYLVLAAFAWHTDRSGRRRDARDSS